MKAPSFCIVLPIFNEESCIEMCVKRIHTHLQKLNFKTAIIAIDDGSTDNSRHILNQLEKEIPSLFVHSHETNFGYGSASRTAAKIASNLKFDYALIMDADGTQAVEFIDSFLAPMYKGVEFIKATRYAKGGKVEGVPWTRIFISRVGNKLAQWFMRIPLTDFTNGFRAIKVEIWEQLKTTERGFAILLEEVYLAEQLGVNFDEVPYTLKARSDVFSRSKFTYSFSVYKSYAQYIFK